MAEETHFNLGMIAGVGFFSNSSTDVPIGAEAEYEINQSWGVGAYVSYDSMGSVSLPGVNTNSSLYVAAAQGAYHFSGGLSGFSLGAITGAGLTWTSVRAGTLSRTHTTLGLTFGPSVRYDYRFSPGFSAGAELNYLVDANSGGGGVLNVMNMVGAARLWF